jgi:hypothetical protein
MLTTKNVTDGSQFQGRDLNPWPNEMHTVLCAASINPGAFMKITWGVSTKWGRRTDRRVNYSAWQRRNNEA